MAYGLKIWNASGQVRMDTTDRTVKYYTIYSGTGPNNNFDVTVPGFDSTEQWTAVDYQNREGATMTYGLGKITLTGYSGAAYKFAVMIV